MLAEGPQACRQAAWRSESSAMPDLARSLKSMG